MSVMKAMTDKKGEPGGISVRHEGDDGQKKESEAEILSVIKGMMDKKRRARANFCTSERQ
ncbi:hypothetical protein J7E38_04055 [Bacillus sp. ISL-35]|uniref:hypothetical protein n=1 Tax=Bacillus sp. ISL-35 TaxID=2819122 RepID=UPI001BE702DD|nr:hypothetical protein [Bacillus sp. ISL-35]MBT2678160.1 hypothetical protein [Bacillus sp. ISL-35]MBT2702553.1 hypothetical protein [Chryseobacterium sp. ISL-80]